MKKYIWLFFSASLLFTACKKTDDGIDPAGPDPEPTADVDIQDFMWKAMNIWYFWQESVDDLADSRFANTEDYTTYLEANTDPDTFFNDKLLSSEDRFSYLEENYEDLVKSFAGVSKSNGLEFGLIKFSGSDDVFGYVQYIVPNSNASTKDITRGDLFTGVDGQTLTIDNYLELLFGDNDTYILNMANIADNTITPNGNEVSLTKEENLIENPVAIANTFDINGNKIGYVMYNRFTSNFNEELNDAFGLLKAEGVTDLVLDLRYNPGGSVNSSRLLASMVYGTNTNDLYIRQRWNSKIQAQLSAGQLEDYFANETGDGSAINSLNLNKVYILATGSSASSSELVMNGLAPYVDVVHIGKTTRGKNEFSITLVDNPDNDYVYSSSKVTEINPDNSWGLQPLVGRNENADGFHDYTDGLEPNIELEEDLANLGILGDVNEPLLARAIQEITGTIAKKDFSVKIPIEDITNTKLQSPTKDNMYLDKELDLGL